MILKFPCFYRKQVLVKFAIVQWKASPPPSLHSSLFPSNLWILQQNWWEKIVMTWKKSNTLMATCRQIRGGLIWCFYVVQVFMLGTTTGCIYPKENFKICHQIVPCYHLGKYRKIKIKYCLFWVCKDYIIQDIKSSLFWIFREVLMSCAVCKPSQDLLFCPFAFQELCICIICTKKPRAMCKQCWILLGCSCMSG